MLQTYDIVPVRDPEEAVEFYTRILGFNNLGAVEPFLSLGVNGSLNFDFQASKDFQTIHHSFAMERTNSRHVCSHYIVRNPLRPQTVRHGEHEGAAHDVGGAAKGQTV